MFAGRILCYAVRMSRLNLVTLLWPAEAPGEGGSDLTPKAFASRRFSAATAMALKSYRHSLGDLTIFITQQYESSLINNYAKASNL